MNIGVQHEIRHGMVFTADYLRNVSTHNLLSIDTNHIGDSRFFNLPNAQAAIATTNASFGGCADVDCAIANGATITDYASNGLDSGYSVCGGLACPLWISPALPHARAAFPGINQNVGANQMLFPIGRSVYNGLQTSLRQNVQQSVAGSSLPESAGFLRVLPLCFHRPGQRLHQLPNRQRGSHQIHRTERSGPHPSTLLRRHDGPAGPLPREPDLDTSTARCRRM